MLQPARLCLPLGSCRSPTALKRPVGQNGVTVCSLLGPLYFTSFFKCLKAVWLVFRIIFKLLFSMLDDFRRSKNLIVPLPALLANPMTTRTKSDHYRLTIKFTVISPL